MIIFLTKSEYMFRYFDKIHIQSLLFFFIFSIIIILLPYIFKGLEKGKYTTFLGYFFIFSKIFDSVYRIILEDHPWYDTLPLHLCNLSLVFAGIYFITRKRIYFNIVYFWFSGAILALILPGIEIYKTPLYIYVFMATHSLEVLAVIYAFIHLDERVTLQGVKVSLLGYYLLLIIAHLYNQVFDTNFMFMNDYVIKSVSFIKPFWLYRVLLITLFSLSILLMYLPFAFNQKEDFEIDELK